MTDNQPIRVVLADDHTMVREALARVLDEDSGIAIVAQAEDAAQTAEAVRASEPDVLVLDFSMPGHDAPRGIQELLARHPRLKVLVLTVHENIQYALRVLESGAQGYLIKSGAADELVTAIKTVHAGQIYLSSAVSQGVLEHLRTPRRKRTGLESLSQREFVFLRKLGAGRSLQQCADEMKISVSTASTYRSRIMEKLELSSTAELIRFALEHNLAE